VVVVIASGRRLEPGFGLGLDRHINPYPLGGRTTIRWKQGEKESQRMLEKMNLLGANVAIVFYVSAILVFILRLFGKSQLEHWIGYVEFLLAIPMVYLLVKGPQLQRPVLYYIQIGCMLAWLIVEALLDYILRVDFRNVRWMVISYVVLFFAGTGGMLGVAAYAGPGWSNAAIILFLIMAVLTFVQRAVTGM
jgi:hypothetical protein